MDYKERELFKLLADNEDGVMEVIEDVGDYDLKCIFSVYKGELDVRTFAMIRQFEQPIAIGDKQEIEFFVRYCDIFDEQLSESVEEEFE